MLETVGCPCGCAAPPAHTVEAADLTSGETFTYLACPDCSLERLSPRPTVEAIGAYYKEGYAPHTGAVPTGWADRLKRLVFQTFWAGPEEVAEPVRRWRPLLRILLWPVRNHSVLAFRHSGPKEVFEFGAAKATDLLAFREAGWHVEGCEPSAIACANAARQGITLQQVTAEGAVLRDGAYGCILFNNVFEHIHDPVAVLRKCHAALVPGGILMLVVPNHASLTGRLFGAAWPGYDAPRHTWGWSPAALARIFARTGFATHRISHQVAGPWMWRSTLDMRHAPTRPGALRRWLARRLPHALLPVGVLGMLLRRGDWIRVVAHRV